MNQARTHNKVNGILTVTVSTGENWYDPTFDLAGNMATGPRPSAPKDSEANGRKFKYTYDAWQRLVKVEESPTNTTSWTTIATFAYNGLNERVIKIDVAASPDVQYDYYYNHQWQVVEVRKDNDTEPLEQWLWHQHYIDAPAIRYYDDNTDGASVALQYFTHDANFNITALVNSSGVVQERYEYDPYGMTTVLDANFANDANGISDYLNPITYCGYRADAETGLYQVRNRYLDPGLGRWVTRDPIGYEGGDNNLYCYLSGSSTQGTDSQGLQRAPVRPPPTRGPVTNPGTRPGSGTGAQPGGPNPSTPPGSPYFDPGYTGDVIYPYPRKLPPGTPTERLSPIPGTQAYQDYANQLWADCRAGKGCYAPKPTPGQEPVADIFGKAIKCDPRPSPKEDDCKAMYAQYKKAQDMSEGWDSETDVKMLAAMCWAIKNEAEGRQAYLDGDCDEKLEAEFGPAEEQRRRHEGAVKGAKDRYDDCIERLNRLQRRGRMRGGDHE